MINKKITATNIFEFSLKKRKLFMHYNSIKLIFLTTFIFLFSPLLLAQEEVNTQQTAIELMNASGNEILKSIETEDSLQQIIESNDITLSNTRGFASELTGMEGLELPPLETFLQSVYENSTVKNKIALCDQMKAEYKLSKRDWMDYLQFHANYAYGYFYNMNNFYTESAPANTARAQHTYNIGANISFSLGDLLNRKTRLKSRQALIDQASFSRDEAIEERKLKILNAYNAILENLTVMKPRAEAVALYNAEMKICENDYINGKIDIIELSLERSRRSGTIVSYQQGRVALHNAVKTLELLTNIKIIKE